MRTADSGADQEPFDSEALEGLIFAGAAGLSSRGDGRARFTQDSPIFPDVWMAYGLEPDKAHDLLLSPVHGLRAGLVARELREVTEIYRKEKGGTAEPARIAHLPGLVVATLYFKEMMRLALPSTGWWAPRLRSFKAGLEGAEPDEKNFLRDRLTTPSIKEQIVGWFEHGKVPSKRGFDFEDDQRRRDFMGLMRLATQIKLQKREVTADETVATFADLYQEWPASADRPPTGGIIWSIALNRRASVQVERSVRAIKADAGRRLFEASCADLHWVVIDSGIDAAAPAFRDWSEDDGGTGSSAASDSPLKTWIEVTEWKNRILACYDFTILRRVLDLHLASRMKSCAEAVHAGLKKDQERELVLTGADGRQICEEVARRIKLAVQGAEQDEDWPFVAKMVLRLCETSYHRLGKMEKFELREQFKAAEGGPEDPDEQRARGEWAVITQAVHHAAKQLAGLVDRIDLGLELDWSILEPFLRDVTPDRPQSPHGTQVAGILAADWRIERPDAEERPVAQEDPHVAQPPTGPGNGSDARAAKIRMQGVCPSLKLIDMRVSGGTGMADEFEVIAALQFIHHLNSRSNVPFIHGANISLSIPHDVRAYGCGHTRVCQACEQLVASGVVVVAAAGNGGTVQYRTRGGASFDGYQQGSITDPGNADGVITVGATHRTRAHQYGVSYFSSRGPTGDGRLKPDLVAPGEKIETCGLHGSICVVDGTSFAAPHVSGAAAMLMARHAELIGQPARIKHLLCAAASDLGRDRNFQGAGMLDVLRALQSV